MASEKFGVKKMDKEILKPYGEHAKKMGIRINPSKKIVEAIITGLLNNEKKHGERYCPCRRVTGNKEEDKKIICPCVYHMGEIELQGKCHCQLFVKNS